MITMNRSRIIPASPEQIFDVLSDPDRLATILPRIQSIETLERHNDHARLATHMAIGNGFGTIRCEGDLRWVAPHTIVFTVQKPVSVENHWLLKAVPGGTEVLVTMSLDLTPMLGPFAQFVPTVAVSDMLGRDLDITLNQIAHCLANDFKERAVAA
jgi:carbon monoxide dehydrogenase subunit G